MIKTVKERRTSPPSWLVNLPAGTYTGEELVNILGITLSALTRTMMKYGEVKIVKEKCYRNLSRNIYKWSGKIKQKYKDRI